MNITGICVFLSLLLMFGSCKQHLIKDDTYRTGVEEMLVKQMELAKGRDTALFGVFNETITLQEKEALEFLYAYMPLSDLADYDGNFYLGQVRTTLKARKEIPWVKDVPEDIFLHFVLPVRVNNENLDSFRIGMYDEILKRIIGLSIKQAALEVNHWCHEKVNYRGSDSRTSAPLSTIKTSWGRCGEESVFTVSAMRAAGIPARQVYTPRWAHTDDNHAWVEVWVDGKWYFLGACEPEADLNMGWFAEPSRRTMLIHTRAYGSYQGKEPVIHSNARFAELNLISNYAPSKTLTVHVMDEHNKLVEHAKVDYRLYNYAEFYPLASNFSDSTGQSQFITGLGDLVIWASKDDKYGFQKVSLGSMDTINIQITFDHPKSYSLLLYLVPPVQPAPRPVSEAGQKANQLRLTREDSIRNAYISSFKDSAWSVQLASNLKLDADSIKSLFARTYGNWKEIEAFLEQHRNDHQSWLLGFLNALSDKDLRDCRADILNDHFAHGFAFNTELKDMDQAFFTHYILSPRIELEMIRPWRAYLQMKFDKEFAAKAHKDITTITNWIGQNLRIDEDANTLSRCPISPRGVYELRVCDALSRNIFFVALCRSMGIPSRLNPINGIPQYFSNRHWNDVAFEKKQELITGKGFVRFSNATPGMDPRYYTNFTIAKLNHGVFETLELEEGKAVSQFNEKIEVNAGQYMLVTGNRITGGSVLSSLNFFEVLPGETALVPVKVRTLDVKSLKIGTLSLKGLSLTDPKTGKQIAARDLIRDKGSVFIWLDPDKEPSKHILNDLPLYAEKLNAWEGRFVFLFAQGNKQTSLPSNYENLPSRSMLAIDSNDKLIAEIEKMNKQELKGNYPVVIASDSKGNVIFFSQGYTIGIGEQLAAIVKFLE